MSVLDLARVVVYRFHEKGLEFFLINADLDEDPQAWKIPDGEMQIDTAKYTRNGITLDHTNSGAQSSSTYDCKSKVIGMIYHLSEVSSSTM